MKTYPYYLKLFGNNHDVLIGFRLIVVLIEAGVTLNMSMCAESNHPGFQSQVGSIDFSQGSLLLS